MSVVRRVGKALGIVGAVAVIGVAVYFLLLPWLGLVGAEGRMTKPEACREAASAAGLRQDCPPVTKPLR